MRKLLEKYCADMGQDVSRMRLKLDGEIIDVDTETPNDHDLDDDEVVDAVAE